MKFLFTIIVTVAIGLSAFAGANPVQQSPWTTNTANNLPTVAAVNTNGQPTTVFGSGASQTQLNFWDSYGDGYLFVTAYSNQFNFSAAVSSPGFTGNGNGLTNLNAANLIGTLNPVLLVTQSVYAADIVSMTNQPLSCASIGGIIANAASKTNAVVLGLGDSYTASTGLENIGEGSGVSTSYAIGKQLRLAYGDGGCAGSCSGVSYGWANFNPGPLNSNLIVPTNIWPRSSDGTGGSGIAVLTTNPGTNAVWTSQINNVNGWVPVCSNIVNLAGICFVTSTNGGSVQVSIGSPSSGVTNKIGRAHV